MFIFYVFYFKQQPGIKTPSLSQKSTYSSSQFSKTSSLQRNSERQLNGNGLTPETTRKYDQQAQSIDPSSGSKSTNSLDRSTGEYCNICTTNNFKQISFLFG